MRLPFQKKPTFGANIKRNPSQCQWCDIRNGEEMFGTKDSDGLVEVAERACGLILCTDCYREHLEHDPNSGIFSCMTCTGEAVIDEALRGLGGEWN